MLLVLNVLKGKLSCLRQFLGTEHSLKIMKNTFLSFHFKSFFVLKIFQFLFWIVGHIRKWLDKKTKVNFKVYDHSFLQILSISLDQQAEVLYSLFLLYVSVEDDQNILKLRCWPLTFDSFKAFLKNKKSSGASLAALFSVSLLKKNISHVILY